MAQIYLEEPGLFLFAEICVDIRFLYRQDRVITYRKDKNARLVLCPPINMLLDLGTAR